MRIKLFFKLFFSIIFFLYSIVFLNSYFNLIKYEIFFSKTTNIYEILKKSIFSTHTAFEITNQSILVAYDIFLKKQFFCCKEEESEEKIQQINIRINNNALKKLSNNKRDYQRSFLLYPSQKWERIKLRLRGEGVHHHHQYNPSIRLNLQKNKSIDLMSHINLTKPEDAYQISNYYNDLLADKINLINSKTKMVNLIINKVPYGIYHMHHRRDENLLRANNRLPGPIFVLNHKGGNENWSIDSFEIKGEQKVFNNEKLLSTLTKQININENNKIKDIWKIAHKDKFAKFFALMNLIGNINVDESHNLVLYVDPSTGKFEPILDDPLGQGSLAMPRTKDRIFKKNKPPDYKVPLYERSQPLYNYMLRDSDFINLKNKYLFQYLNSFGSTKNQKNILKNIYDKYQYLILSDFKKRAVLEMSTGFKSIPLSNSGFIDYKEKLFNWVENRNKYLKTEIENSKIIIEIDFDNNLPIMKVIYKSNSNIVFNIKHLNENLKIFKKNFDLIKSNQDNQIIFPPQLFKNEKFKYQWTKGKYKKYFLDLDETEIFFQVSDISESSLKKILQKSFINEITQKEIKVDIVEKKLSPKFNNLKFIKLKNIKKENLKEIILKDKVVLKENLIVEKNQKLIIQPGTEVFIDKNISIFSFGKVIMKGEKNKPIIIKRSDPKTPWGNIALINDGANGSHFEHIEVSGGTIGGYENIFFKGMLSTHWVDNIIINNSIFYNNSIGDDIINFVHSKVKMNNNKIFNCNMDCIDFDYSSGQINNSQILNAKNDLLDFMSSEVYLENLTLKNSNDKAISAGERSIISLKNSLVANSILGIASKDGSKVLALNTKIINNELGLSVYRKNLRYSNTGFIELKNSTLNNKKNTKISKKSEILIN